MTVLEGKKSKIMTQFYIVRHGESEGNLGIVHSIAPVGESDLTDNGRRQVQELAQQFKGINFDYIISSDLARTQQTAEILAQERMIAIESTRLLRERSYGNVTKEVKQKIKTDLKKLLYEENELSKKEKFSLKLTDDMESTDDLIARVLTLFREIALTNLGKNILVVSHGEVIRALLIHLGEAEYHELPSSTFANAGYIVLETDGVDFYLKEIHGMNKTIKGSEE